MRAAFFHPFVDVGERVPGLALRGIGTTPKRCDRLIEQRFGFAFFFECNFARFARRARRLIRFFIFNGDPLRPLTHGAIASPPLSERQVAAGIAAPPLAVVLAAAQSLKTCGDGFEPRLRVKFFGGELLLGRPRGNDVIEPFANGKAGTLRRRLRGLPRIEIAAFDAPGDCFAHRHVQWTFVPGSPAARRSATRQSAGS